MSRRALALLLAGACGAASAGVGLASCRRGDVRPNVLFVVWDTVRADHLSLYGHRAPTTPRLEAFARDAAVYERATSRGMWTLPSHAAMFTGLTETTHGAVAHAPWLDERQETLAERLGAAGYDTFAWSANAFVATDDNLLQGFHSVQTAFPRPDDRQGRYAQAAKAATRAKLLPEDASTELSPAFTGSQRERWARAMFKDSAPVAHQALLDFLAERPGRGSAPFFAFLNLMEAHSPRLPTLESRRAVADAETVATGLRTDASVFALTEAMVGERTYTDAEVAAIGAVYDAALRDLDAATGDLLDDLRAKGVLDDTVVVVVADHGEMLGEHGAWEHRYAMWEPLLHVPLVVRYPRRIAAGRVPERVSTADLFATVLDLAGLPVPPGVASTSLVGRTSFEPVVVAQMLDPFSSRMGSVHEVYPHVPMAPFTRTFCAAWRDHWKLVYASDGGHGLYDLVTDPGETTNRYAAEPATARGLEEGLAAFERTLPVHDPSQRSPEDLRNLRRLERRRGAAADPDQAAALEALGYAASDIGVPQAYPSFCGPGR